MNAEEARRLSTEVVTLEQKAALDHAMAQIRQAAQRGGRFVYVGTKRLEWLTTVLTEQGYTVRDISNQRDGQSLEVKW